MTIVDYMHFRLFCGTRKITCCCFNSNLWERLVTFYLYRAGSRYLHGLQRSRVNFFQVLGRPRSGTTLLSSMLNSHSATICLSEPFQSYFWSGKVLFPTGTAAKPSWWYQHPLKLMATLAKQPSVHNVGFKEWTEGEGDGPKDQFIRRLVTSNLINKTIVIVRDPRDVWVSTADGMTKGDWTRIVDGRRFDQVDDNFILRWCSFMAWVRETRLFTVRYEDLVADPERVLRKVCQYLGITFESDMLIPKGLHGERGDERALAGGEIFRTSIGKYQTRLSSDDIRKITLSCGALMEYYGYVTQSKKLTGV